MGVLLSSFANDLNIAVIGASGGIGRAFVDLLIAENNVQHVYCFSRASITCNHEKTSTHLIDITDENSIEKAASVLQQKKLQPDILIVASGMLHGENVAPEKSLKELSLEQFHTIFAVNSFGPALIAKHFLPLMPKDRRSVAAFLSARVGSIEDNRLGGWYAYRASKAALNMVIKNAAIEIARRFSKASVIGLHPGTVDTNLSEPFQANVANEKLFTPAQSARYLLQVINQTTPEQTGQIFAWDGEKIPY